MNNQPDTLPDVELATRAQQGCLASFEALVYRYEKRVFRFVTQASGNTASAAEITQDSFVAAFQALGRFDPAQSFSTWLFTIARRKCIDHYRRNPIPGGERLPDGCDEADPGRILADKEAVQNLWQAARRLLPAPQFEVIWLRYAEELSVQQVAQVTGRTQTHVKVLLYRARQALQRELTAMRDMNQTGQSKLVLAWEKLL